VDPAQAFGRVLRKRREEAGLTQEQLSFEADIRRTYVSLLELGHSAPTLTVLFRIAAALDCQPSSLLAQVETELSAKRRHPAREDTSQQQPVSKKKRDPA
jgi:transcriptional regulator with XRE-family HTH domain